MITTYSGKTVDPFAIRPEDIELEDIAHDLSMTCRFGGHCRSFYSVAEHIRKHSRPNRRRLSRPLPRKAWQNQQTLSDR